MEFAIVWKKGYQETCPVTSAVTTKVKGVVYTNLTRQQLGVPANYSPLYERIWDPTDYTIPTSGGEYGEYGGFFITTNVIITPNQTRGQCPEDYKIEGAVCTDDSHCPMGDSLPVGNGVFTGKCVDSTRSANKTCEIFAWCPVELDDPPLHGKKALLEGSKNFTVLIKNVIEFPKFGSKYKRRNILEKSNTSYLQSCIYNTESDPFCPVFRIGDIVEAAGHNFSQVAKKGAVVEVEISWNCDLDFSFMEYCRPKYSFERMDSPEALISPGWNFRTAEYHEENRRTLFKRYGIKFLVKVSGQAGKFNLVPLLINLGSGLALLGLATIFCDILVLRCMKNRRYYQDKKYLVIRAPDAFDVLPEDGHDSESNNHRDLRSANDFIEGNEMGCIRRAVSGFFEYKTPKTLRIKSKKLSMIHLLLQLLILCYIIGYVIVQQKGYQIDSPITFAVTTKVKGVIFTNFTSDELGVPPADLPLYNRIWDPTDYIIPPSGGAHGDFFILTNVVITPGQVRGVCPEEEDLEDARCTQDSDCPAGSSHPVGNGIYTGKCVLGPTNKFKTCEVRAWCPVEVDQLPLGGKRALLEGSRNSTVLIKNSIEFPYFGPEYKRRNILESSSTHDLEKCIHHPKDDPFCPIFPEISPGWNFRSGKYHEENRRTLYKNYGIKFLVEVRGYARKFNIIPLLVHLASCIALLKFATYLCDIFLLKLMTHRQFYKDSKFVDVESPEPVNKDNQRNGDTPPIATESAGDTANHTDVSSVEILAVKDSQVQN
ncbi:P2X purinoceptor 4 [Orchesella cincta]|uniref:P2X purinoceptor 4 n=1 Tax=Orchesella cincta TaxID=48709 RepID=A0A1D2NCG2_ORCCI|nr:P2X purinoceptor 4 [Orchesella cincta]